MSAGKYRIPVVLQRPDDIRSESGQVIRTYTAVDRAFASLRFKGQSEDLDGGRAISRRTWQVRLRPFAGLAGGWRVLAVSRVLRVLSVTDPDGRGREWLCEAEEEGE